MSILLYYEMIVILEDTSCILRILVILEQMMVWLIWLMACILVMQTSGLWTHLAIWSSGDVHDADGLIVI